MDIQQGWRIAANIIPFVVGVLGNASLVVVIYKLPKQRLINVFIVNGSVAAMVGILTNCVYTLVTMAVLHGDNSPTFCRVKMAASLISFAVVVSSPTLIAINNYLILMNSRLPRKVVVIAATVALSWVIPTVTYMTGELATDWHCLTVVKIGNQTTCHYKIPSDISEGKACGITLILVNVVVPAILVGPAYVFIGCAIIRDILENASEENEVNSTDIINIFTWINIIRNDPKDRLYTILIIYVFYVVSTLPFALTKLVSAGRDVDGFYIRLTSYFVGAFGTCIWIIYGYCYFRTEYKNMLCCLRQTDVSTKAEIQKLAENPSVSDESKRGCEIADTA